MAEFTTRRVVAIAAVAGALVGGAVAGGVAEASSSASRQSTTSSPDGSSPVATAAVVRTNLTNTVQVGGSIGYQGSYTIAAPSGTSPQQLSQAQQTVTADQQQLSADQTAESDGANADDQAISAAQAQVDTARSALSSDQATETRDCAGTGSTSAACSQDEGKVSQDQTQLSQATQQLAAARLSATRDLHQNQARVVSDQTRLAGDRAALASLDATAVNPSTTYTWLPKVGDIIRQDQPIYSLSNQPVPLLYGPVAAYRAFYVGMSDGADVSELTRDLNSLGYGGGLAPSAHYSPATAVAVERWQAALGLAATGRILFGEVVFEPGPIRVTSVTPAVGATAGGGGGGTGSAGGGGGGGTVLTATGTTPVVTVALAVTQEYLVKSGDTVTVVLPDGTTTVGGHVETVGDVATCPGGSGTGTGNGSSSADQSPCSSSGTNNPPTVTVTIALDKTPPGATLDQAPVNVNVTTQRAENVLAVPVNALLALEGGGFGVDVVAGNTSYLVGVTTGLYSNTLVEISGPGITAGMRVEVPSS